MLEGDGNCGYRAIGVSLVTVVTQMPPDHQRAFGLHLAALYQSTQTGQRMGWRSSSSGGSVGHGYRALKVHHEAMSATFAMSAVLAVCARTNIWSVFAMFEDVGEGCAKSGVQHKLKHITTLCVGPQCLTAACTLSV